MADSLYSGDDVSEEAAAEVSREGCDVVVGFRGEFDIATVELVEGALRLADAAGGDAVVVDLRHVRFMGAVTLAAICARERALDRQDRRLFVRAPSHQAQYVLDLCQRADLVERRDRAVEGLVAHLVPSVHMACPRAGPAGAIPSQPWHRPPPRRDADGIG